MKAAVIFSFSVAAALLAQQPAAQVLIGVPVKGNPYSAEAVTESTLTLPDGNRVVQRSSSMQYRDGQGRERRELIANAANARGASIILISDPVAGVTLSLNPAGHTGIETPMAGMPPPTQMPVVAPVHGGAIGVTYDAGPATLETMKVRGFDHGVLVTGTTRGGPAELAGLQKDDIILALNGQAVKDGGDLMTRLSATPVGVLVNLNVDRQGKTLNFTATTKDRAKTFLQPALAGSGLTPAQIGDSRVEDLGDRSVEGVMAHGTRMIVSIPAGQAGNERPLNIVNETWFSSELGTTVMSSRSDPRTGESKYRLTNIVRSEPAASLFEAPADFTITRRPNPAFVPR